MGSTPMINMRPTCCPAAKQYPVASPSVPQRSCSRAPVRHRRQLLAGIAGIALVRLCINLLGKDFCMCSPRDQLSILKEPDQANAAVETDAADSPYIQELLRRTEEFREQRRKERLAAYDRRNFRDYFAFESSSLEVAKSRGISEETYYAIQKWMAENDKPKPIR